MHTNNPENSTTKNQTDSHSQKTPKVRTLTGSFPLKNNSFTIDFKEYRLQNNYHKACLEIHCITTNSHCSRLFDDFKNGKDFNADYQGIKYQVTLTPDFITFLPNRRKKKVGSSPVSNRRAKRSR